jgi:anthranilate phosphoribosyltransferase
MTVHELIAAAGEPLSASDTRALFDAIFGGQLSEDEIVVYLSATANRKPTVDELVGAVTSMRAHMRSVTAPSDAIDLCGTGGDGLGTLNISTAASFVIAGCGVPVAKHGNRSASSRSGAADVLEALGVKIGLEPEAASRVLARTGIVFLFAQTHHPAMKYVGGARKQIGRRTIFNLLGPLASPARVTRQLAGVFSADWLTPYAQALSALGSERAWIVHGKDGLDELSISGPSQVAVLEDGAVSLRNVSPDDAGLGTYPLSEIRGGDAAHNADALRRLLEGQAPAAYHDIVVLNAAAGLIVAGKAQTLRDGAVLADTAIRGGRAHAVFQDFLLASNQP